MLTEEQTKELKKQIKKQIEHLPKEQREIAEAKINAMSEEELERLLEKQEEMKNSSGQKCIFCSISSGESPSYKIEEDEDSLAVLDINPISRGHSLIIPKKHISSSKEIPKNILKFAEKTSSRIKKTLDAKDVLLSFSEPMGHAIIVLLPIYEDENLQSPRKNADKKELKEVQDLLEAKKEKKPKMEKIKKPKASKIKVTEKEKLWLPKRIP